MGKHTELVAPKAPRKRKAPTKAKPTKAESSPPEPETIERLERTARHLELLQASVEATFENIKCKYCGGGASPALIRESANVARAVAQLEAESRQREKHDIALDADITPEVLDGCAAIWLSELTKARREAIYSATEERIGDDELLGHS